MSLLSYGFYCKGPHICIISWINILIWKYNLYYDEKLVCAEDYDLYARAIKYIKMANIQESLVNYRVYESNTSSTKREERIISSFIVQDKLLDLLSSD